MREVDPNDFGKWESAAVVGSLLLTGLQLFATK
jgi:hypothetical protein